MAAFARADRGVGAVTRRCVVGSNFVSPCSRNCIPEPADATDTLCDEGSITSNIGKIFLLLILMKSYMYSVIGTILGCKFMSIPGLTGQTERAHGGTSTEYSSRAVSLISLPNLRCDG